MIAQMNQRERIFVIAGGVVVLVALLYFAVLSPYLGTMQRLDGQIAARSRQVEEVGAMRARYQALQMQVSMAEKQLGREQGVSPLSFIEELVQGSAGKENLLSMRPQPPEVRGDFSLEPMEIKLEKLTLRQLLELLAGVEGAPSPMQVRSLQVRQRYDDRTRVDVTLTVAALRRTS